MSDLRQWSKTIITDFIELYKSYPCLWKTKCNDYKNRNRKDAAYGVLLKKIQEIEPNATRKTVTAKINSLRGSFRRELKKIEESKRSGGEADEIYETHLWYYDLLFFTKDQDQDMHRENVNYKVENEDSVDEEESMIAYEGYENTDEDTELLDEKTSINAPAGFLSTSSANDPNDSNERIPSPSTSSGTSSASNKGSKRKRKTKAEEQADEPLTKVCEKLRNTNNDDACDIFGKLVAAKLRTLSTRTKIYTEKLINDLLFEAEMGNVDENTKIVTALPNVTNRNKDF